jgi:hypothetical protein
MFHLNIARAGLLTSFAACTTCPLPYPGWLHQQCCVGDSVPKNLIFFEFRGVVSLSRTHVVSAARGSSCRVGVVAGVGRCWCVARLFSEFEKRSSLHSDQDLREKCSTNVRRGSAVTAVTAAFAHVARAWQLRLQVLIRRSDFLRNEQHFLHQQRGRVWPLRRRIWL